MAPGMRTTVVISLVLVFLTPSRTFAARLPVPVTCFRRCPITDADCIDACQRDIETESSEVGEEFPGGEKRASAFVRIGRPAMNHRSSSFIRIGKNESPQLDHLEAPKRKDSFVRIGRASAFVRIGRKPPSDLDALKRASSFVRIGKSAKPEDSAIEVDTTGNKRTSSFVRIGRDAEDQSWLSGRM